MTVSMRDPKNTSISDVESALLAGQYLGYARVSTDQTLAGVSIQEQIREMAVYATNNGMTILDTYHEAANGFRAEGERPEFQRMIERAERDPLITGILVCDLSRFGRDAEAVSRIKADLLDHGVRVISITEQEDDPSTKVVSEGSGDLQG